MSAYEHLLHPTAQKSVEEEQETPRHAVRWVVNPLRFLISLPLTCWHRRMSRPFTRDGETYRVCLRCGIHRNFDLDAWKSRGSYYYEKNVTASAQPNSSQSATSAVPRAKLRLIA